VLRTQAIDEDENQMLRFTDALADRGDMGRVRQILDAGDRGDGTHEVDEVGLSGIGTAEFASLESSE
jgi:hypothetical protein